MSKPKFRKGQVVFVKTEGEYMRMVCVNSAERPENARLFNPRWGGMELHHLKELRPLTRRERGGV